MIYGTVVVVVVVIVVAIFFSFLLMMLLVGLAVVAVPLPYRLSSIDRERGGSRGEGDEGVAGYFPFVSHCTMLTISSFGLILQPCDLASLFMACYRNWDFHPLASIFNYLYATLSSSNPNFNQSTGEVAWNMASVAYGTLAESLLLVLLFRRHFHMFRLLTKLYHSHSWGFFGLCVCVCVCVCVSMYVCCYTYLYLYTYVTSGIRRWTRNWNVNEPENEPDASPRASNILSHTHTHIKAYIYQK